MEWVGIGDFIERFGFPVFLCVALLAIQWRMLGANKELARANASASREFVEAKKAETKQQNDLITVIKDEVALNRHATNRLIETLKNIDIRLDNRNNQQIIRDQATQSAIDKASSAINEFRSQLDESTQAMQDAAQDKQSVAEALSRLESKLDALITEVAGIRKDFQARIGNTEKEIVATKKELSQVKQKITDEQPSIAPESKSEEENSNEHTNP